MSIRPGDLIEVRRDDGVELALHVLEDSQPDMWVCAYINRTTGEIREQGVSPVRPNLKRETVEGRMCRIHPDEQVPYSLLK